MAGHLSFPFTLHRLRSSTAGENTNKKVWMDCHVVSVDNLSFRLCSLSLSPLRRLYFAQLRLRPHPSRVCVTTPGCGISSGPDGPTQGTFYTPLPSGERASVTVSEGFINIKTVC